MAILVIEPSQQHWYPKEKLMDCTLGENVGRRSTDGYPMKRLA
jgi:hypothetical protein